MLALTRLRCCCPGLPGDWCTPALPGIDEAAFCFEQPGDSHATSNRVPRIEDQDIWSVGEAPSGAHFALQHPGKTQTDDGSLEGSGTVRSHSVRVGVSSLLQEEHFYATQACSSMHDGTCMARPFVPAVAVCGWLTASSMHSSCYLWCCLRPCRGMHSASPHWHAQCCAGRCRFCVRDQAMITFRLGSLTRVALCHKHTSERACQTPLRTPSPSCSKTSDPQHCLMWLPSQMIRVAHLGCASWHLWQKPQRQSRCSTLSGTVLRLSLHSCSCQSEHSSSLCLWQSAVSAGAGLHSKPCATCTC